MSRAAVRKGRQVKIMRRKAKYGERGEAQREIMGTLNELSMSNSPGFYDASLLAIETPAEEIVTDTDEDPDARD